MTPRLTRMDWTAVLETARTAAEIWDRRYVEFLRTSGDPEGAGSDQCLREKMKSELGDRSDEVCDQVAVHLESLKLCQSLRPPSDERIEMPVEVERTLAHFIGGPPRELLHVGPRSSVTRE